MSHQQEGQLLDVVAIRQAVIASRKCGTSVVPELGDEGGGVGHDNVQLRPRDVHGFQ